MKTFPAAGGGTYAVSDSQKFVLVDGRNTKAQVCTAICQDASRLDLNEKSVTYPVVTLEVGGKVILLTKHDARALANALKAAAEEDATV